MATYLPLRTSGWGPLRLPGEERRLRRHLERAGAALGLPSLEEVDAELAHAESRPPEQPAATVEEAAPEAPRSAEPSAAAGEEAVPEGPRSVEPSARRGGRLREFRLADGRRVEVWIDEPRPTPPPRPGRWLNLARRRLFGDSPGRTISVHGDCVIVLGEAAAELGEADAEPVWRSERERSSEPGARPEDR